MHGNTDDLTSNAQQPVCAEEAAVDRRFAVPATHLWVLFCHRRHLGHGPTRRRPDRLHPILIDHWLGRYKHGNRVSRRSHASNDCSDRRRLGVSCRRRGTQCILGGPPRNDGNNGDQLAHGSDDRVDIGFQHWKRGLCSLPGACPLLRLSLSYRVTVGGCNICLRLTLGSIALLLRHQSSHFGFTSTVCLCERRRLTIQQMAITRQSGFGSTAQQYHGELASVNNDHTCRRRIQVGLAIYLDHGDQLRVALLLDCRCSLDLAQTFWWKTTSLAVSHRPGSQHDHQHVRDRVLDNCCDLFLFPIESGRGSV